MSQSLVDHIYERYGEIGDSYTSKSLSISINSSDFSGSSCSSSCSPVASPMTEGEISENSDTSNQSSPQSSTTTANDINFACSFFIPPVCSPRKTQSGYINMTSVKSLVMCDKYLSHAGDREELENCCRNVFELDLCKNVFTDWNEIKKILKAFKNLRFLNLSHNPLHNSKNYTQKLSNDLPPMSTSSQEINEKESHDLMNSAIKYFQLEWNVELDNEFTQLDTLILNSCFLNLRVIQFLLECMPNLSELHLASNDYSLVTFSTDFRKSSIKILYLNNNNFTIWSEILKFGTSFPMLENLVLSDNPLAKFTSTSLLNTNNVFNNLEILILNKLNVSEWNVIEQLYDFPNLKHVRIQNIPLLNDYNEEEKYYLMVGHLADRIITFNGSKITNTDKENCERSFIRYYLDFTEKPNRYYELENRHGKLNKLADIYMDKNKKVNCKIKYRDQNIFHKIDVRQTVGDFKKQLEKFVGYPSSRFRVFYIDIEALSMSMYGPEELKHMNRCLYSFNIVEGDEFEIDLKSPPVPLHSASEHQFQTTPTSQYHTNCLDRSIQGSVTRPVAIRQRKISDNSSQSGESQVFSRATKKTKPISFFSGYTNQLSKSTNKKNESVDDFCSSLPNDLNKKNRTISENQNNNKSINKKDDSRSRLVVFKNEQEINQDVS